MKCKPGEKNAGQWSQHENKSVCEKSAICEQNFKKAKSEAYDLEAYNFHLWVQN